MIPLVLLFACLGWYFNRPIPDSSAYPLGDIDQLFLLATCEWERGSLVHQPQNFFQGPGFHGMGESLFFSDLLLGTLPTYMLLAPMFGPALSFNLLHGILPALNGLVMVGALHQFTARPVALVDDHKRIRRTDMVPTASYRHQIQGASTYDIDGIFSITQRINTSNSSQKACQTDM